MRFKNLLIISQFLLAYLRGLGSVEMTIEEKIQKNISDHKLIDSIISSLEMKNFDEEKIINHVRNIQNDIPLPAMVNIFQNDTWGSLLSFTLSRCRFKVSLFLIKSLQNSEVTAEQFDNSIILSGFNWEGISPLQYAISKCRKSVTVPIRLEMIKSMLEMNSTLRLLENPLLKTIQQHAIFLSIHPKIMELLLSKAKIPVGYHSDYAGEDWMIPTLIGFTITTYPHLKGMHELIALQIKHGANINEYFPFKNLSSQVLHVICGLENDPWVKLSQREFENYMIQRVKILRHNGADLHAKNSLGQTPWDIAKKRGKVYLKELLNKPKRYPASKMEDNPAVLLSKVIVSIAAAMGTGFYFCALSAKASQKNTLVWRRTKFLPKINPQKPECKNKLEEKVHPAELDLEKQNRFYQSCIDGDIKTCQELMGSIDYNSHTAEGLTPLMLAVQSRHLEVVSFLLTRMGIDANVLSVKGGKTALLLAENDDKIFEIISQHLRKSLEKLIERSSDENVLNFLKNYLLAKPSVWFYSWGEKYDTLLTYLIHKEFENSALYVMDQIKKIKPAEINAVNDHDQTALMIACATGQIKIAKTLLNLENIKTNLNDRHGDNALCKLLKLEKPPLSLAKVLIENGCKLKHRSLQALKTQPSLQNLASTLEDIEKQMSVNDSAVEVEIKESKKEVKQSVPVRRRRKRTKLVKLLPTTSKLIESQPVSRNFYSDHKLIQNIHYNHKLNHDFFTACMGALKRLAVVYAGKPEGPEEIFLRHALLLLYILDLYDNIQAYNRYVAYRRLDPHERTVIDSEQLQSFKAAFRHRVLPAILQGTLVDRSLGTEALSAVETTAADLIKLLPGDVVNKVSKIGCSVKLSDKDQKDLCGIFGANINVFDEKNLPNFCIDDSLLTQIIKQFHQGLVTAELSPLIHLYYVKGFAIPLIVRLYRQIISSDKLLETKSIGLLTKPKTITNFNNVEKFFADSWSVLRLLLISCGDVRINEISNDFPLINFIEKCRAAFRNPTLHGKTSFLSLETEEVKFLCHKAEYLVDLKMDEKKLPIINWKKTVYGKKYLSQLLAEQGLIFRSTAKKAPNTLILEYLYSNF